VESDKRERNHSKPISRGKNQLFQRKKGGGKQAGQSFKNKGGKRVKRSSFIKISTRHLLCPGPDIFYKKRIYNFGVLRET
jgi:hypothetical protein